MFIAILVLLGLAGAIWYFARKQAQDIVTLTQEDVAVPTQEQKEADLKEAEVAALEINKRLTKMTEKIDAALAAQPEPVIDAPVAKLPSKKVKAVVAEAPVVEDAPVVEVLVAKLVVEETPVVEAPVAKLVVEEVPVVEAPKPAKKKRRYYPKKK